MLLSIDLVGRLSVAVFASFEYVRLRLIHLLFVNQVPISYIEPLWTHSLHD